MPLNVPLNVLLCLMCRENAGKFEVFVRVRGPIRGAWRGWILGLLVKHRVPR